MNGHPTMRAGCPHTHQDTLGAGGGGWLSWGEGDNPVLASPGERSAETAQGKCWGQVGCLAACFPPWCGDAEPSAGGGNAIKRPGGVVRRGRPGRKQLEWPPPGLNRLFLLYSKSPSCSPCCTRASSSPKQTTGETSTRPRTAAGKAGSQPFPPPRPLPLHLCCLCCSPAGPKSL